MFAGLPGTGLGGIFYALLVCWMPVRELWRLARGRSSPARWAFVVGQVGLVVGIAVALWAEAWAIEWLVGNAGAAGAGAGVDGEQGAAPAAAVAAGRHLLPALAWTPFALLALLVGGVHLARLLVRRRDLAEPARPSEVGAAP